MNIQDTSGFQRDVELFVNLKLARAITPEWAEALKKLNPFMSMRHAGAKQIAELPISSYTKGQIQEVFKRKPYPEFQNLIPGMTQSFTRTL